MNIWLLTITARELQAHVEVPHAGRKNKDL